VLSFFELKVFQATNHLGFLTELQWHCRQRRNLQISGGMRRSLKELINLEDPALPLIKSWIDARDPSCEVELLSCSKEAGQHALLDAQVTSRSPMGAICYETGGLLIDSGFLRVFGAGSPRMSQSLMGFNTAHVSKSQPPPFLVVAYDVIGGFFALNGGGLNPLPLGKIAYHAPDSLAWESLELNYSEFLQWTMSGALSQFYEGNRWSTWKVDVSALSGNQGFSFYPYLFAEGPPLDQRSRKPVPIEELWGLHMQMAASLQKKNSK